MAQHDFLQTASPVTPAANYDAFYFGTDGVPHYVDSTGAVHTMGGLTGWYDVTSYGVTPGNTATLNTSNLNTLLATTAPSGATIYFPGGLYQFNGAITVGAKAFVFQGQNAGLNGSLTMIQLTANLAGSFFNITAANWFTKFQDICFAAGINQTAGACINVPTNSVGINVNRCAFNNNGGNWFDCIDYIGSTGSGSANQTVIDACTFQGFSNHGVHVDSTGASLAIVNTTFNGTSATAAACFFAAQAGAIQIDNSDLIGAVNNLLLSPAVAGVCASVYVNNTYFDNSTGSCVKISGAGATVRCRFIGCSMTLASTATNFSAVEISSSGTTLTTMASGIDFSDCSMLNTFGTALTGTNGFNITGASDFTIDNCRIEGWVNGVSVTPAGLAGACRPQITNCYIGGPAAGLTGAIGTGIILNAGSFTYGSIVVAGNNIVGATTAAVTDNSLAAIAGQSKQIFGNSGLALGTASSVSGATFTTTETVLATLPVPANGIRAGTTVRIRLHSSNATTTGTLTFKAHYGAAGTIADTLIATVGPATTVIGATYCDALLTFRSATTVIGNGCANANGVATVNSNVTATTTMVSNVASFLTITGTQSAGTATVVNATIEVLQQ